MSARLFRPGRLFLAHPAEFIKLKGSRTTTMPPRTNTPNAIATLEKTAGVTPIVIVIGWLFSTEKHLRRYMDIYADCGAACFGLVPHYLDILSPKRGEAKVADFFEQISDCNFSGIHALPPVYLHLMSSGAYYFGQSLCHSAKPSASASKNRYLLRAIRGMTFDSPVDVEGVGSGLSQMPSIPRPLRQPASLLFQTWSRNNGSTYRALAKASTAVHDLTASPPQQYIWSTGDVVTHKPSILRIQDDFRTRGVEVESHDFGEDSGHCSHMISDKQRYEVRPGLPYCFS